MKAMPGPDSIWTTLLAALLLTCSSQPAAAQRSVPVTTTQDFANALQDQTITEIILDPSGTGVSTHSCTSLRQHQQMSHVSG